jgi:TetR/AcrR family fatty acid metabolism transcriptional regulator
MVSERRARVRSARFRSPLRFSDGSVRNLIIPSEISAIDQIADPQRSFIEEARRAQIIECAIDTIAELGFAQASLSQIAKRARISAGVISYYFAGKDDLIREVAAQVFAKGAAFIGPRVNGRETATETLRAFIEASVGYVAANPNYTRAVMNIIRAGRAEGGALRYDAGLEGPRREGFESILLWGQQSGEFRRFAVPVMARTIIEAVDAVPPQLADNPDLDMADYARELAELFDRATRAASQEPAR